MQLLIRKRGHEFEKSGVAALAASAHERVDLRYSVTVIELLRDSLSVAELYSHRRDRRIGVDNDSRVYRRGLRGFGVRRADDGRGDASQSTALT